MRTRRPSPLLVHNDKTIFVVVELEPPTAGVQRENLNTFWNINKCLCMHRPRGEVKGDDAWLPASLGFYFETDHEGEAWCISHATGFEQVGRHRCRCRCRRRVAISEFKKSTTPIPHVMIIEHKSLSFHFHTSTTKKNKNTFGSGTRKSNHWCQSVYLVFSFRRIHELPFNGA